MLHQWCNNTLRFGVLRLVSLGEGVRRRGRRNGTNRIASDGLNTLGLRIFASTRIGGCGSERCAAAGRRRSRKLLVEAVLVVVCFVVVFFVRFFSVKTAFAAAAAEVVVVIAPLTGRYSRVRGEQRSSSSLPPPIADTQGRSSSSKRRGAQRLNGVVVVHGTLNWQDH